VVLSVEETGVARVALPNHGNSPRLAALHQAGMQTSRVRTLSVDLKVSESRGRLVRRLDVLLHRLKEEKENYSNKPKWIITTGDLERLRNEARYCFVDAELLAQDALQELSAMDFTKFEVLDDESHKARYDWIDPSRCKLLDATSEEQCIKNLDRLIELIETVRKREEIGSEMMPAVVPSSPQTAEKTTAPIRDLATLLKLKSMGQSQAADALGISQRAIRYLVEDSKLNKTIRGRIACDQKFVDQFNSRHSPIKK
jgi:hypothetical protein